MAKNFNEIDPICHVNGDVKKTLAAEIQFYAQKKEDELPFRESNLSRTVASLIVKKGAQSEVCTFNIPARDNNEIHLKTEIAVQRLMLADCSASGVTEGADGFSNSPAFTTTLMLNAFKGKTPGEILAADPSQKDELLKGKAWLEANLAKYPANKKQIVAIEDAIKLLDIGELAGKTVTAKPATNVLSIYKREYKYMSKKDDKGNNLVYSIDITCDPAKKMPFTVTVMNCYAPVVTSGNGQTVVKTTAAVNTRRLSISLTDSEWIAFVGQIFDLYKEFKMINATNAFKRAAENSYNAN